MKDSSEPEIFTTRRVAVVEGDADSAEMLHTFFRLMDLEPSVIPPDSDAAATISRLNCDVVLLDADLPRLRAVELASEIRRLLPGVVIIFMTAREAAAVPPGELFVSKPRRFEDLLAVMELLLEGDDSELKIGN